MMRLSNLAQYYGAIWLTVAVEYVASILRYKTKNSVTRLQLRISMVSYILYPINAGRAPAFEDWVTLLTLSFAPLLAHIISGAPHPSYLHNTRPRWHERMCHYNPTSIVWRYFSIIDRRLRARTWTPFDLAAANALFWTDKGWDGSEQMITQSMPYSTYLPSCTHAELFSEETFKSIVTSLQGIQASYFFIMSLATGLADIQYLGADQIFYPLAILGLLRLFAVPWVWNNFQYTFRVDINTSSADKSMELHQIDDDRVSLDRLILLPCAASVAREHYYRPTWCWQGRVVRALYMLVLLGIWSLAFLWAFPVPESWHRRYTITSFFAAIFYLVFTSVSVAVHAYYFIKGQTKSTVIPCASQLWYKIYTVVMFVAMAVMSVISFVETTKSVCGKYTSLPPVEANDICSGVRTFDTRSNESDIIGFALKFPYAARGTVLKEGEFWLRNFSGTCAGGWTSELRVHAMGLNIVNFTGLRDWGNGTATEL